MILDSLNKLFAGDKTYQFLIEDLVEIQNDLECLKKIVKEVSDIASRGKITITKTSDTSYDLDTKSQLKYLSQFALAMKVLISATKDCTQDIHQQLDNTLRVFDKIETEISRICLENLDAEALKPEFKEELRKRLRLKNHDAADFKKAMDELREKSEKEPHECR